MKGGREGERKRERKKQRGRVKNGRDQRVFQ